MLAHLRAVGEALQVLSERARAAEHCTALALQRPLARFDVLCEVASESETPVAFLVRALEHLLRVHTLVVIAQINELCEVTALVVLAHGLGAEVHSRLPVGHISKVGPVSIFAPQLCRRWSDREQIVLRRSCRRHRTR